MNIEILSKIIFQNIKYKISYKLLKNYEKIYTKQLIKHFSTFSIYCNEKRNNKILSVNEINPLKFDSFSNGKKTALLLHTDSQKNTPERHISSPSLTISVKFINSLPLNIQPYLRLMRMDRPIGTWLVFLPCAWSVSLATSSGQLPDPKILTLLGMGSFFMRSAGCIINDMWDKDFDKQVARTKDRPIACGQISQFRALCFLSFPLSVSLAILLTFNMNTIILGVCSLLPCIVYPLAKRFTYWPQAFLGLTFNWGAVMGWSAVTGSVSWSVLPLYISSIAWTLIYDTIYAFQDIEDDLKIGVKSTAINFGENSKYYLYGFTSLVSANLLATGLLSNQTWLFYLGVTAFTAHLLRQIHSVNLANQAECGEKFRSNRNLGIAFWLVIIFSNLIKKDDKKDEISNEKELDSTL